MKVFGVPRPFDPDNFYIEPFHRAGLGLETDTTVFLAPVPAEVREDRDARQVFPGLIISTLDPRKWGTLWRLSVTLQEESGVVSELLSILRNRANIAILETLTTETSKYHEVYAVIDIAEYMKEASNDDPLQVRTDLAQQFREAAEEKGFLDKVVEPSLFLAPLDRLRRAQEARGSANIDQDLPVVVNRGRLSLGKDQLMALLRGVQPNLTENDIPRRVLLFSDTEEKYLSCFFPGKDQTLLRLAILHRDVPGAIAEFCACVAETGANILNSYSRLQRMGEYAEWRAIVDISHIPSCRLLIGMLMSIAQPVGDLGAAGKAPLQNPVDAFLEITALQIFPSVERPRKTLRLGKNPFTGSNPVGRSSTFVGRETLVTDIFSGIRSENFLLEGFSRAGKSSVLEAAVGQLAPVPDLVVVYTSALKEGGDFWLHIAFEVFEELAPLYPEEIETMKANLEDSRISSEQSGDRAISREIAWKSKQVLTSVFRELDRLLLPEPDDEGWQRPERYLVIALDESQRVFDNEDGASRLSEMWLYILNGCRNIRWIVAAGVRSGSPLPAEFLAKFTQQTLRPLEPEEAIRMVRSEFEEQDISIHDRAVAELLEVSGCCPAYLQVICRELWNAAGHRAKQLDILVVSDVEAAARAAELRLRSHFDDQYRILSGLLPEEILLRRLLQSGESVRLFDAVAGQQNHVSLEVFPGLRISHESKLPMLCAVEIFRNWARGSGLIEKKLYGKNRHVQEALSAKIQQVLRG